MTVTQEFVNKIAHSELVNSVIKSVENAMVMCHCKARCVGVSTIPEGNSRLITGMIGLHGKVTGFATLNMPEQVAMRSVCGLLQEELTSLSPQIVDGAGELTNIVVGGIKSQLAGTEWAFNYMTTPSVIIGDGCQIAFGSGIDFVAVTFEVVDEESVLIQERLMTVSLSLISV